VFNEISLKVLEKGLNAASLRQNVISNNLANIDTPGFKKSDVRFEDLLAASLDDKTAGGQNSVDSVQPLVQVDQSTTLRSDGNNVDVDQEMTTMAKNELYYDSLVRELSSQLGILRMVITEKP